jgi:NTP pyrophosphatase (non-canonical NTP hydrolase)
MVPEPGNKQFKNSKMIELKGFNEVAKQIHQANADKGFYEIVPEIGTSLMLVVSELAEALEAHRKNIKPDCSRYFKKDMIEGKDFEHSFMLHIKDSFNDEIADTMIRLFDLSGHLGIDLEFHIEQKLKYNSLRPYKHGKDY